MAAFTSCAAASISRSSENWIVIDVPPSTLVETMLSTPAIVENSFSSGVATEDAIVDDPAPGRLALTVMVGKSTVGKSLIGNPRYDATPSTATAIMISAVMMGRRMKSPERFICAAAAGTRAHQPPVEAMVTLPELSPLARHSRRPVLLGASWTTSCHQSPEQELS